MARWLVVVNDIVTNIVESPAAPDLAPGETAYVAVTGAESPGDNLLTVLWYAKLKKQAALDARWATVSDYDNTVKSGTNTSFTDAQYLALMAGNPRNYRTKRTAISAAATVAAVNAVDVTAGWPSNP